MATAKLHELLAVEGDLEGVYKKILQETATTFTKKENHFIGAIRELKLLDEEAPQLAPEVQEMMTTVGEKLSYQADHVIRYLDAVLQKEATNQHAKADIIIDGKVIASDVPATFLLGLENKLKALRVVYNLIPTLAPNIEWVKDEDKGLGVYANKNPEETYKVEKVVEPVVLYEATNVHPAQVREAVKSVTVGKYVKKMWSGMLSYAEKSLLLKRHDKLSRAVKQARQRANRQDIVNITIGDELINYIHGKE